MFRIQIHGSPFDLRSESTFGIRIPDPDALQMSLESRNLQRSTLYNAIILILLYLNLRVRYSTKSARFWLENAET